MIGRVEEDNRKWKQGINGNLDSLCIIHGARVIDNDA